MKRLIGLAAMLFATAAAAGPLTLVEIDVDGVADLEAFRAEARRRCILVGDYAYTAVPEEALAAFDAGGRAWAAVAAADGGVFLVLPAGSGYAGPARATVALAGGNRGFILTGAQAEDLIPFFAFNVLGPAEKYSPAELLLAPIDPLEAAAVERVRRERLRATVTRLQDFYSRHFSYHGNEAATAFLEGSYREIKRTGVERQYFEAVGSMGSKRVANVIARIEGVKYPDQHIIVGAHFDSKSFGSGGDGETAAPGADDNASGTAAVLECARLLSDYAFDRTLIFVGFNAEEIGLYGSAHYASLARQRGDDIRAMLNLDMGGYDADGTDDAEAISDSASYDLAELMASKAAKYTSIDMTPNASGSTPSDHASFWRQGYRAVWEFEGWNDHSPYIHTENDTIETFNLPFFEEMTRILVATAFDLAGVNTSPRLGFVEPDGDDYADESFTIRWWDVDADDGGKDATIALYWAADNTGEGGTLLASGIPQNDEGNRGSYVWDTAALPPGRYYVYGVIDDGVNELFAASCAGPVYVTHEARVVVYPNPVRRRDGHARVTFDGLLPGDSVAIYDMVGTKLWEARADGRQLRWETGGVASGVYVYRVTSAVMSGTAAGKLAVLR